MALTNTEKEVSQLVINKVPTNEIYQQMVEQNLINEDELYLIQDDDKLKVNGILKGDGAGGVSAAVANTDYATCTNLRNGRKTGTLRTVNSTLETQGYQLGENAFAEGSATFARGTASHVEGTGTTANGRSQHVQGEYNISNGNVLGQTRGTYAHIVGNGTSTKSSNAHTLDWSGNAWFAGDVYVGSTSGTNKDEGSQKLVNSNEVLSAIEEASETYFATQGSFNSDDFTVLEVDFLSSMCSELNNRILACIDGSVSIIPLDNTRKPCLLVRSIKTPDNNFDNIILKYSGIGSQEESSKFTGLGFEIGSFEQYAISVEWNFGSSTFTNKKIDKIEDKVFVATYGTTTYEDIKAAYDADKIIFCKKVNSVDDYELYILNYYYENAFEFSCINGKTSQNIYIDSSNAYISDKTKLVEETRTINGKALSSNITLGKTYNATLTSSRWSSSSGILTQTLTVSGLVANYNTAPTIDLALDQATTANKKSVADAWGKISGYMQANTTVNSIIFTVYVDTAPTVNIPIRITTYD